jgi:hypothetical protein
MVAFSDGLLDLFDGLDAAIAAVVGVVTGSADAYAIVEHIDSLARRRPPADDIAFFALRRSRSVATTPPADTASTDTPPTDTPAEAAPAEAAPATDTPAEDARPTDTPATDAASENAASENAASENAASENAASGDAPPADAASTETPPDTPEDSERA